MVRKKIDSRLRTLIENGVRTNQRSLVILVGDRGRHQVVNLHYILSKSVVKARPSVLWCYKSELGFSSHRKKRLRQFKKKKEKGLLDLVEENPFELFISSTNIRYCYYKETHKILGKTFGMLVLQDFEAITPNILARTIETVEGGGIIVILLRTMTSLRKLYTMAMDIHARYRTAAHQTIVPRFNERFLLSLSSCKQSLVLDDEFNVLPISTHALSIKPVGVLKSVDSVNTAELLAIKKSLMDTQPVGALVEIVKTLDQAKALLTFIEAISEKTLRNTVALTAPRGRGKSATLGLAIAAAVVYGYSNIFITSPTPENLSTLFEFLFKGLDSLRYEEHSDYGIVQSTNPAFHKAIVRVDIYRQHRQTVQYILPKDSYILSQAELVIIDEAAAIPLPYVKELLGPYLVFMASTVNGYEGTGRALSLKLIEQLKQQCHVHSAGQMLSATDANEIRQISAGGGRIFREIVLKEPIRYGEDDQVENWLNKLLCLDAQVSLTPSGGCPHPSKCDLYYINRDTLMSYHNASEAFLQRMMGLYVSSHYKNSPNDLQLLSDAPAHHLFCLLGPVDPALNSLPELLCVLQICLEGQLSKTTVLESLSRGHNAAGDMIPWTLSQQFQDADFPSLSGARIVRIATHPAYQDMGYGTRAIELLKAYYRGDIICSEETVVDSHTPQEVTFDVPLVKEKIVARKNLPPLLSKLTERKAETLHYLGVSFGLTERLYKFWKRSNFFPVYIRLTPNVITGEHTCIMLCPLEISSETPSDSDLAVSAAKGWLQNYLSDFQKRFTSLLSYQFRRFSPSLALSVLDSKSLVPESSASLKDKLDTPEAIEACFSPFDLKRFDSYARGIIDYHVILDLVPLLASLYFTDRLPVRLSAVQSAILIAIGLQRKTVEETKEDLNLPVAQILALFNRIIRKIIGKFDETMKNGIKSEMSEEQMNALTSKKSAEKMLKEKSFI